MNLSHGAPVTAGWYFTQRLLSIPHIDTGAANMTHVSEN